MEPTRLSESGVRGCAETRNIWGTTHELIRWAQLMAQEILRHREREALHAAAVALSNYVLSYDDGRHAATVPIVLSGPLPSKYRAAKAALEPKPEPDWIDRAVDEWVTDGPVGLEALKRRLHEAQP